MTFCVQNIDIRPNFKEIITDEKGIQIECDKTIQSVGETLILKGERVIKDFEIKIENENKEVKV